MMSKTGEFTAFAIERDSATSLVNIEENRLRAAPGNWQLALHNPEPPEPRADQK
jgi:hypothetical protein